MITKQAQKGGIRSKCWVANVRTCIRKQKSFTKSYKSRQGNGDAYVEIQAGELELLYEKEDISVANKINTS